MNNHDFNATMLFACDSDLVDVFLDANIIRSGPDRRQWADRFGKVFVVPEIALEIRKYPKQAAANQFIELYLKKNRQFSRDSFVHQVAFDLLTISAAKAQSNRTTDLRLKQYQLIS